MRTDLIFFIGNVNVFYHSFAMFAFMIIFIQNWNKIITLICQEVNFK